MWEWIEKLRSMSEVSRRRVAYFIAGGITFVIVLVWMAVGLISESTFYAYPDTPSKDTSLTASLKEDVGRLREAGSEQVSAWRGMWEAFKEVPQGTSTPQ